MCVKINLLILVISATQNIRANADIVWGNKNNPLKDIYDSQSIAGNDSLNAGLPLAPLQINSLKDLGYSWKTNKREDYCSLCGNKTCCGLSTQSYNTVECCHGEGYVCCGGDFFSNRYCCEKGFKCGFESNTCVPDGTLSSSLSGFNIAIIIVACLGAVALRYTIFIIICASICKRSKPIPYHTLHT